MTVNEAVETTWFGRKLFGLRGTSIVDGKELARLAILVTKPEISPFLVDVPVRGLPYLPDMSSGSDFRNRGNWHHYPIYTGYEVVLSGGNIQRVSLNDQIVYESN